MTCNHLKVAVRKLQVDIQEHSSWIFFLGDRVSRMLEEVMTISLILDNFSGWMEGAEQNPSGCTGLPHLQSTW